MCVCLCFPFISRFIDPMYNFVLFYRPMKMSRLYVGVDVTRKGTCESSDVSLGFALESRGSMKMVVLLYFCTKLVYFVNK